MEFENNPVLESQDTLESDDSLELSEIQDSPALETGSLEPAGGPDIAALQREIENLRGLQGVVQRKEEEKRELQRKAAQLEALVFQEQTKHLPPQDRVVAMQARWQQQQLQAREAKLREFESRMSEMENVEARRDTLRFLSQTYGVPIKDIESFVAKNPQRYDNGWAMEGWAIAQADGRKSQRREERISTGADNFGNTGGPAAPRQPASSLNEASSNFVKAMSRRFPR